MSDKDLESICSEFQNFDESTQESNQSTNQCHICSKSFLFRFKKTCKFCNKTVCSEHSQKRRHKTGYEAPQRICQACEEKIVLKELKEEIDKEIEKLSNEVIAAKLLKESSKVEIEGKIEKMQKTKDEIGQLEVVLVGLELELDKKLKDESENGERIRNDTEFLRKCLDERIENEKRLLVENRGKEEQLQVLLAKAEELKNENEKVLSTITEMSDMIKVSILKSEIESSLCVRCVEILGSNYYTEQ
jgi:hypothetical protein